MVLTKNKIIKIKYQKNNTYGFNINDIYIWDIKSAFFIQSTTSVAKKLSLTYINTIFDRLLSFSQNVIIN